MGQSLYRDAAFVRFWCARTVSLSGGAVSAVLLPILVFQISGSAAWTAVLTTVEALSVA